MLRALQKHPEELGNKGLSPSVPWRSDHKVCENHGKIDPALTLACCAPFFFPNASLCSDSRSIQTPKNITRGILTPGMGMRVQDVCTGMTRADKFKTLRCRIGRLQSGFSLRSTFLWLFPPVWELCGTGEGEPSTFYLHSAHRPYCTG